MREHAEVIGQAIVGIVLVVGIIVWVSLANNEEREFQRSCEKRGGFVLRTESDRTCLDRSLRR